MAVKGSGALSMTEIAAEFGGSTPYSLSQFYRGGGRVPNGPAANNNIATSGAISLSGFYGSQRGVAINVTISAHTNNLNLRSLAIANGWDQATPLLLTVTINSGIFVRATSTGAYALNTGTSYPAGSTLTVINNGNIVAQGGGGGGGGYGPNNMGSNPGNGGGGGPAIYAAVPMTIYNYGVIGGGGGGGGGGAGGGGSIRDGSTWWSGASGSAGATFTTSLSAQGSLGAGAGGGLGAWGGSGGYQGGSGGPPGACTSGNANITWGATGTRYGALN